MPRVGQRTQLNSTARKAIVVVAFVAVFLTVGVPRWLAGDTGPASSNSDASFAKVCREHGGTLGTSPASGTQAKPQPVCTVRYGQRVYRMDAITPHGFDEDTARFQRQGCEEARREQSAAKGPGDKRQSFVYHPDTGVCEDRP
jgi:hypothetical protein